ncbi:hypothetical protein LINGRAHAP2_LOCUS30196 [Linum grandiflorum]
MAPKPPDPLSGLRRPSPASPSSPPLKDKESFQANKKVKSMNPVKSIGVDENTAIQQPKLKVPSEQPLEDQTMPDAPIGRNFWTEGSHHLFGRTDNWYIAESDSEDVAETMRDEDDEIEDEDDDLLCPSVLFSAAEKASFRREWRSALIVKGLGRRVSYLPLARRLNFLWARNGELQITDMQNGCYLVRFREKEVDRATKEGARAKYARVCVEIDLTKPLLPKYKVDGTKYLVVYEGLTNLCTNCGKYGAPAETCHCRDPPPCPDDMDEVPLADTSEVSQENDKAYGPSMTGQPKGWKKGRKNQMVGVDARKQDSGNRMTAKSTQNRFSVLQSGTREDSVTPDGVTLMHTTHLATPVRNSTPPLSGVASGAGDPPNPTEKVGVQPNCLPLKLAQNKGGTNLTKEKGYSLRAERDEGEGLQDNHNLVIDKSSGRNLKTDGAGNRSPSVNQ